MRNRSRIVKDVDGFWVIGTEERASGNLVYFAGYCGISMNGIEAEAYWLDLIGCRKFENEILAKTECKILNRNTDNHECTNAVVLFVEALVAKVL